MNFIIFYKLTKTSFLVECPSQNGVSFNSSRFGRLYHNTARFMKMVVEAVKKLVVKTTRKEDYNYEER